MRSSDRQNVWLAVPPAVDLPIDLRQTLNVSTDGEHVQVRLRADDYGSMATMPPKTGEMEELLDACGRNPSATLRLEVPDSLSAMVAANTHPDSYEPPSRSTARRPAMTPPATPSAKAQLGLGTARVSRPRPRQDWKIWTAPVAACGVLAFALLHAGSRGSAQAATPAHLVSTISAAASPGGFAPTAAAQAGAAAGTDPAPAAAVAISFRRAARVDAPAAAAPPGSAGVSAGRPLDLAREAARKGDNDTANQLYARAIAEGDSPCEAWTERASLEVVQGNVPAALQMYANALTTNAHYVPALLGRADVNWAAGNKDVAAKQYADIVGSVSSDLYPKRVAERAGIPAFVAPPAGPGAAPGAESAP
jgi:hypothetical protein